jgi:hypothetical protein
MRPGRDLRELLYFALPFCRVIISSCMLHHSSAHTEPQCLYRPYRINGSPKRQLDIPSIATASAEQPNCIALVCTFM